MAFNKLIPQPGDNLNISQQDLLANNLALNSVYGTDHYAFNDLTANSGFHNTVTTPSIVGGIDPTSTTNDILYSIVKGMLPLFQYSTYPLPNTIPTPITNLQSPATAIVLPPSPGPGNTSNIFNFTGLVRASATLYAANFLPGGTNDVTLEALIIWAATAMTIKTISGTSFFTAQASGGNTLQISNNATAGTLSNVYWTLRFHRIET